MPARNRTQTQTQTSPQMPDSLYYLRARMLLWMKRPMVWGSAAVLVMAGVFLTEYWSETVRMLGFGNQQPTTPLPNTARRYNPQRGASSAPVGGGYSAPVLPPPVAETTNPLRSYLDMTRSAAQTGEELNPTSQELLLAPDAEEPATGTRARSPFALTDENGALRGTSLPGSRAAETDPDSGIGGLSSSRSSRSSMSTSPLRSGLERSTPAPGLYSPRSPGFSQSTGSSSTSTGRPSLPNAFWQYPGTDTPGTDTTTPGLNSPGAADDSNPASSQSGSPPYSPQTSPPAGTTGYTLPPAIRTNAAPSSGAGLGSGMNSGSGLGSGLNSPGSGANSGSGLGSSSDADSGFPLSPFGSRGSQPQSGPGGLASPTSPSSTLPARSFEQPSSDNQPSFRSNQDTRMRPGADSGQPSGGGFESFSNP
jgi:hypothetical protein